MTHIKSLISMACMVACASFLLMGGGMERVGQVGLVVYAVLIVFLTALTMLAKVPVVESPVAVKIAGRASYLYVVAVSAFTEHMVIALVLAISWVLGWIFRAARKAEAEKATATNN
ncbi:hypothetical protein [Pseudomonas sp. CJQ_11]|uniref:hypothetical protein n=1 Tax=Pseudomonas sp. CJQ_11 TaxID=3367169 RepID=UPI00370A19CA